MDPLKRLERLEKWIKKEIAKAERAIDRSGPFYELQSRIEVLEEILEKL